MVKVIYAFFFNSITKGIEILPPREVGNLDCALYIFKNQMTANLYNCVCRFAVKKVLSHVQLLPFWATEKQIMNLTSLLKSFRLSYFSVNSQYKNW